MSKVKKNKNNIRNFPFLLAFYIQRPLLCPVVDSSYGEKSLLVFIFYNVNQKPVKPNINFIGKLVSFDFF